MQLVRIVSHEVPFINHPGTVTWYDWYCDVAMEVEIGTDAVIRLDQEVALSAKQLASLLEIGCY